MKQKLIPIISIAIGLIAFFLTYKYLHDKEREFQNMRDAFNKSMAKISVMVARRDIPSGTMIKVADITNQVRRSRVLERH